jgi:hypothetical protein
MSNDAGSKAAGGAGCGTLVLSMFCCIGFMECKKGCDESSARAEIEKREEEQQKKNDEVRANSKDLISKAKTFVNKKDFGNAQRILNDLKKANVQSDDLNKVESELSIEKEKSDRAEKENKIKELIKSIDSLIASEDGIGAYALLQNGYRIVPDHAELKALEFKIEPIKKAQETQNRKDNIDKAIEIAEGNIKDKVSCENSPTSLKSTFELVKANVQKGDESYPRAKKTVLGLEKCRKISIKILNKTIDDVEINVRKLMATMYENRFLDQGIDMRIKLSGKRKENIRFTYVLIGRPFLHKLEKETTLFNDLRKAGFSKATFGDGYNESWSYDLTP